MKDSSGDLAALEMFAGTGLPVLVGGTPILWRAQSAGAVGLLTGLGSAFPRTVARAWEGDLAAQAELDAFERGHPRRVEALKSVARARLAAN